MPRCTHFCFCILLFLSLVFQAHANTSLSLNKRLGLNNQQATQEVDIRTKLAQLEQNIAQLKNEQLAYDKIISDFPQTLQRLEQQIAGTSQAISISHDVDYTQQASMAYVHLSELKESEASINHRYQQLVEQRDSLPSNIAEAQQALSQHLRTPKAPDDTPAGQKYQLQVELLNQQIATLQSQLAAIPVQLEINQLQQQLSRQSLKQQESLIEKLNHQNVLQRQALTDDTIATFHSSATHSDPLSQALNATNNNYVSQLKQLNSQINATISQQEIIEKRYQSQSIQLSNVQEQVTWVKTDAAFGERFLSILHSLPKLPNLALLQNDMADARIQRYQFDQAKIALTNERQASSNYTQEQLLLLDAQQSLLLQLSQSNDQYINELGKLRVSYEQLTQLHNTLRNTLNEHLFWVPNAPSIGPMWITEAIKSLAWLLNSEQWQPFYQEWQQQNHYWAWLVILLVLCLMAQDLLTPKFNRLNERYAGFVGNVTQDKIIYTVKTLFFTLLYALIKPVPIIFAGIILYSSKFNFVHAMGVGLLAMGCNYLVFRFIYLLSSHNGIFINHFKQSAETIKKVQLKLLAFVMVTTPLMGVIGFTEALDASFVRNSIGRMAFIILCLVLFNFYKSMFMFIGRKLENMPNKQNMRLIQKMLWLLIIAVPLFSAALATIGYYFTALQMLLQLQVSIVLGLSFILLYQVIKRWMLIEQRVIAFDRAKAKRAEQLAQRERGEVSSSDSPETYEEPVIDLDTIASQSIGLVRSILLLAFLACLIGLLSHTHTAVLSFLDSINLWTTNSTINGIEQQVPITVKSLFFGLALAGFSMMIAKNLPGLLELTILQKLDLSPGTGFAITTVSSYLVIFFGLLIGFSSLGVEWSKLQWLIAALSVGLGFGLQEIFANFISGLIILFEKPIRIGDTVTIRNLTGTVSKIQIRATTIVDWDRKEIIVPNKAFITEQLVNWSLSDPITRVIVKVAVARDADPTKVEMLLHQAVRECDMSLAIPEPEVWFAGFGQHTQDYEVRSYAKDMDDRWPLRHHLHKQITKKLRENQVELAYPQMEIHVNNGQSKDQHSLLKV